ncbi:family 20 glycosylhydrolase [Sunxiuqinia elliptica]|uniref:beta-N-acetylhexosaminidase n=1 Tax=Sunxiuqinia elliptica TaxID=655355 RepID=A0A4R6GXG7_9BACT|nr:family 20 glycosylhydrolase [Sunxiuqinia elliptica]TDO00038.1 hexosaminidase [Sunxiuqinia elliptica]TDO57229.1 hexosaminidase [Sunxiuqinia elliptica]
MKKLKINFFILVSAMVLAACSTGKKEAPQVAVVPQPNNLVKAEGTFTVNAKTTFVIPENKALNSTAGLVNMRFKQAAGFELTVAQQKPAKNFIAVELAKGSMGDEAYELEVAKEGVTIKAATERGAFYGLITMLQLLPAEIESTTQVSDVDWTMACVTIKDAPRFVWRGMHLDVCRHFVPVDFIKKQLDVMAMFKMNTFHWHLTEDQGWRIEIKKYPKLTELGGVRTEGDGSEYGGYYTQEEIKEVVAYASERFINVVPEIELPGHALAALVGYPELSCTGGPFKVRNVWGVEPDVYCAGKEETFHFLEDVIDEVVPLFPYEYFHIGGDECPKTRWEECPDCQRRMRKEGLKDEHELQSYFVQRIEKVLLAHGRKMIGWDEILEGGLAPSATVMSWRGEAGGIEAAKQGHDVVMTPGNWVYLDHYQGDSRFEPVAIGGYTTLEESYGYDPVPADLKGDMAKHVLGTQGNVWSEYMYTPELFEYRIYPRIIALAEVGWTETANKNYEDFLTRMNPQFERLDYHNINYHIPLPEGPVNVVAFTDQATLDFTTTRPVKMVYTTDGTEPNANSTVYEAPLTFTENTTVKIRTVLNHGKMSKVRTIQVEKQTLKPAVDVKITGTGLKGKYAEGTFIAVADLDKAKSWKEIVVTSKSLPTINKEANPTGAILEGYITIPEDGIYEMQTNFDQFFIGDELLINNDKEVKRFSRNNKTIALAKGTHPVKIVYLNNNIGGYPQSWNHFRINYRKVGDEKFTDIKIDNYSY